MLFKDDKVISEDDNYIKIDKEEFIKNCMTKKVFKDENYDYYHKMTLNDVIVVYGQDIGKDVNKRLYNLKEDIFNKVDNDKKSKWDYECENRSRCD